METNQTKRGRGRPPKPKQHIDEKNPLEVIRKPVQANTPANPPIPEGDNAKYTTFALEIMKLPKIDVRNPEQLRGRMLEYFKLCAENDMKPGVVAFGLAIGLDRRRLWEIRSGSERNATIPQECKDIIHLAYDYLEAMWESYMNGGKINPVSGIFLGKNHFGYQDKQEYVLTPNQAQLSGADAATIEQKYAELPDVDGESE